MLTSDKPNFDLTNLFTFQNTSITNTNKLQTSTNKNYEEIESESNS